MADSLRDQLVKAGLATSAQAKKAQKQADAAKQARRRGAAGTGRTRGAELQATDAEDDVQARVAKQLADKREKDRALAQAANTKAAEKSLRAEMRQLILMNDQRPRETGDDDVPYNFVHGKKIKRIHVSKPMVERLSRGTLVIVNNDGNYHLVSREIADRIRARDPKRIISAHEEKAPEPGSDDEYYARFEVPDDLDW